ncbi:MULTISPECIES: type II secretion system protein [unclassified Lebetimonas]|uniref:type II secretion system protein n=1 Tax=unclassified Lebetimonas TaxID=2648158 RepID=UPI000464EFB7|nr:MULTISPECIES: type II secretion system protein [unclassified Lebetimonas]
MKKAFTMIELVFVIVILGILAAVALPKFLGVAQQAHEANLKAFVGTLNRSVGPTLWSTSIAEGHSGNIDYSDLEYFKGNNENNLTTYTDIPKEVKDLNLSKCNDEVNYTIVGFADKDTAGANYFIVCKNGNANQSPNFILYKQTAPTTELKITNLGDHNISDVNGTNGEVDKYSGSPNEEGTLLK